MPVLVAAVTLQTARLLAELAQKTGSGQAPDKDQDTI